MQPMRHKLSSAQRDRLEQFGAAQCVDIHCHCLPGLDDGPATMQEAVALCRALVDDGITTVIATPHQLGRFDNQGGPSDIPRAVSDLNNALEAEGVPLAVMPGAEVRVDERIPSLLESGRVLTLAGAGVYLLLELPHEVFIDVQPLLRDLAARGITAIISHPETNAFLIRRPQAVLPWLGQGARLQLTAASLTGAFGPDVEQVAWHWLGTRTAALVATDAHDVDFRRPQMSEAIDRIAERLGHVAARRVCIENPMRVLAGEEISPLRGLVGAGSRK